jgi:catechol 2,3-dioxygenase-like lactoylglutathione lyase family enzyme
MAAIKGKIFLLTFLLKTGHKREEGSATMARIKHIAVLAKDTTQLSEFYKTSFGLKEVARSGDSKEAIYLSDGYINLAILPARGRPEGIYHFGFEVENLAEGMRAALDAGATKGARSLPKDGRFAECFVLDPVGTRVDLSQQGWKV